MPEALFLVFRLESQGAKALFMVFRLESEGAKVCHKQEEKNIVQLLLVLAEQIAICTNRAPCLASQALSFESALSLLPLLEQGASVHPLFATSPGLAAAV